MRRLFFFTSLLVSLLSVQASTTPSWKVEDAIDSIEPPIPIVKPLIDYHVRDVSVCKGPGGKYYMTGTTDDNWGVAEGIRLWESDDLENWKLLGKNGFVWTFDKDGKPWQQKPGIHGGSVGSGRVYRGIWAPEIHYLKGTFWIPYSSSNVHDSGLLKSASGLPEGPYVDIDSDGPIVEGIDATLIEDENGDVYYIWAFGRVRKLNDDMSGFTDDPEMKLFDANGNTVGYEGVNVFHYNGMYYLMAAEWNGEGPNRGHDQRNTHQLRRIADGRYDCMVAQSENLLGPYSPVYLAIPHAGHNMMFEDHDGNLWATIFGNDEAAAPFRENPALIPFEFGSDGHITPKLPYTFRPQADTKTIRVSPNGNNRDGSSWKNAYTTIQAAIDAATANTSIWIQKGTYVEDLKVQEKAAVYLFGCFEGDERQLDERKLNTLSEVQANLKRPLEVKQSSYLRFDGLTFSGGKASGERDDRNGGGVFLEDGGESIRFIDCTFRDNRAERDGGAVYAARGSSPLFIGCRFQNNNAQWKGGAVAFEMSEDNGYHARFYNCEFYDNAAQVHGGVAYVRTDLKQTGTIRFINCVLSDNFSLLENGIITLQGGTNLIMSHCLVEANKGMSNGAVVASLGDVPGSNRIVNSLFRNNRGGVLFYTEAVGKKWLQLEHNAFSDNKVLALMELTGTGERWSTAESLNEIPTCFGNTALPVEATTPNREALSIERENPLVGKGTTRTTFPLDLNGNARTDLNFKTIQGAPSIGPLEP